MVGVVDVSVPGYATLHLYCKLPNWRETIATKRPVRNKDLYGVKRFMLVSHISEISGKLILKREPSLLNTETVSSDGHALSIPFTLPKEVAMDKDMLNWIFKDYIVKPAKRQKEK